MKAAITPAQKLARDRARKRVSRQNFRAAGLRLRQLWLADSEWEELQPWVAAMGYSRQDKTAKRSRQVMSHPVSVNRKEQGVLP